MSALVERPIAERQNRLHALSRLVEQLHPDKPLERGYAMVQSRDGKVVMSQVEAASHSALNLKFKDGELAVGVGDVLPPAQPATPKPPHPTPPKRKSRSSASNPAQDDLFS
jgi:exodeoxyribonuclease VII large subunit